MTALAATGLSVRLGGRDVVDGIDLEVPTGGWLGVVGPNGAGKTTLLRALAGLVPAQGRVVVGGQDLAALRPRARARRLAVVPQVPLVPVGITVADYVLLGRTPHIGIWGVEGPADLDAAGAVMELLGLSELARRRVESLSGGERQRVLVARALAQDAPVLLLDEPTTALDIGHQLEVLELIDDLRRRRGLTVVATMHDLTLAGRYADELLLLAAGRAAVRGPATQVLTTEHIAAHYGTSVRVLVDCDGITVVPVRPRGSAR